MPSIKIYWMFFLIVLGLDEEMNGSFRTWRRNEWLFWHEQHSCSLTSCFKLKVHLLTVAVLSFALCMRTPALKSIKNARTMFALGAIYLWRPHGGGSDSCGWGASSPMWTSTHKIKIRVHWRHSVFSCKEVGVFINRISSLDWIKWKFFGNINY